MSESGDPVLTPAVSSSRRAESVTLSTAALDLAERSGDCDVIATARFRLGNLHAWQSDTISAYSQLRGVKSTTTRTRVRGFCESVFRFRVTTVRRFSRAVAAILTSSIPIGSPWASRIASRSPARTASTRGSESHAQFDPIDVSHEQRGRFRAAVPRRRQQRSPCLAPQPRSVAARDRGSACFRMTSDRTFVSSRHFTSYGCLAVRAIHEDGVACAR